MKFSTLIVSACVQLFLCCASANGGSFRSSWISDTFAEGRFALVDESGCADIVIDSEDFELVRVAATALSEDLQRVTGKPARWVEARTDRDRAVYVGTLGSSQVVERIARSKQIDLSQLAGAWESFLIVSVEDPEPGVSSGLLIVGSDRRGTAYGVFELSEAMGVSPWYWWADVPVRRVDSLFVDKGQKRFGPPSVRYRGIFINDEDWGLHPWARRTFEPESGGIGPKTYERVFELMLRLKANTIWPAMHEVTKAFNLYPENRKLADRYGIVMASSHAEPMLRNNVTEWTAPKSHYNYATHKDEVLEYWEERLQQNGSFENVYTLGMRGIHDSGITAGGSVQEKAAFLESIMADQRRLLSRYVDKDLTKVPQVFTPYKETLELYESGMRVPDEVTLVWPDDNHGYIRRLPNDAERKRSGGSGVYYHLSYLGSPMAYLWLNTTPPALVWEEMSKAYDLGAREYWIVNVGDIKPGEIGIDLFLQMAWDIDRWNLDTLSSFLEDWGARTFGSEHSAEIASVMQGYFQLNFQRRPEHLQWWLPHGRVGGSNLSSGEARDRVSDFAALVKASDQIKSSLPSEALDAFFQLVEYPVKASANANWRYFHTEQYGYFFNADPDAASDHGALARQADADLRELTRFFNEELSEGKWRGIMAEEPADSMWRSYRLMPTTLPAANMVSESSMAIDRSELPYIGARGTDRSEAEIEREAESYDRSIDSGETQWQVIPGLGRSGDSIALYPVLQPKGELTKPQQDRARVEYDFTTSHSGEYTFYAHLLATFPLGGNEGLRIAFSIDGGPLQILAAQRETGDDAWKQAVLKGVVGASSGVDCGEAGAHTLSIYALDAGVVIDKWFLSKGEVSSSFLGGAL